MHGSQLFNIFRKILSFLCLICISKSLVSEKLGSHQTAWDGGCSYMTTKQLLVNKSSDIKSSGFETWEMSELLKTFLFKNHLSLPVQNLSPWRFMARCWDAIVSHLQKPIADVFFLKCLLCSMQNVDLLIVTILMCCTWISLENQQ